MVRCGPWYVVAVTEASRHSVIIAIGRKQQREHQRGSTVVAKREKRQRGGGEREIQQGTYSVEGGVGGG